MIPPQVTRAYRISEPMLRASGIDQGIRRAEPSFVNLTCLRQVLIGEADR